MRVKSFRDLKVWQLSHKLSIDIARLVKLFPKDEQYDLSIQMRRSARSIPSNISEGFGRFHFNDKLTFYERSRASLDELKNHFSEALGNRYITNHKYDIFNKRMNEISFLLSKLMKGIIKARENYEQQRKNKGT
ncbi:four helix bundle protein [candidate division WOR-3 bacterium]|nr:four helix bundle protein [candidate division WOR-3 bacterium]MCK4576415.1 four helix bundle protein [candidate division WOR-3 bacterium]